LTIIKFDISQTSNVLVEIFNYKGQKLKTLVNEHKFAGSFKTVFNAVNLASGIYFYRITTDNFIDVKRMLLIK